MGGVILLSAIQSLISEMLKPSISVAKLESSSNSLHCMTVCADLSSCVSLSQPRRHSSTYSKNYEGPPILSGTRSTTKADFNISSKISQTIESVHRNDRASQDSAPPLGARVLQASITFLTTNKTPFTSGTSSLPNCDDEVARNFLATLHSSWIRPPQPSEPALSDCAINPNRAVLLTPQIDWSTRSCD